MTETAKIYRAAIEVFGKLFGVFGNFFAVQPKCSPYLPVGSEL